MAGSAANGISSRGGSPVNTDHQFPPGPTPGPGTVGVGVGDAVAAGNDVGVRVGDCVGRAVAAGATGVGVAVAVGLGDGGRAAVEVGVGVIRTGVRVGVGVNVGARVAVAVGVTVGVRVSVGVGVLVDVDVGVGVQGRLYWTGGGLDRACPPKSSLSRRLYCTVAGVLHCGGGGGMSSLVPLGPATGMLPGELGCQLYTAWIVPLMAPHPSVEPQLSCTRPTAGLGAVSVALVSGVHVGCASTGCSRAARPAPSATANSTPIVARSSAASLRMRRGPPRPPERDVPAAAAADRPLPAAPPGGQPWHRTAPCPFRATTGADCRWHRSAPDPP